MLMATMILKNVIGLARILASMVAQKIINLIKLENYSQMALFLEEKFILDGLLDGVKIGVTNP